MTARRGSLRYKIVRLARTPRARDERIARGWRIAMRTLGLGGRVIVTLAIFAIVATLGVQVWRVGAQNVQLHRQIVRAERDNEALASASARLSDRISKLQNPEYLVPLIHEQLGLAKPNEIFIELQPPPAPNSTAPHN